MDVDNLPPTLVQAGKNNQLKVGHPINDGYSFISTRSFPIRPVLPQNTKKEEKKKTYLMYPASSVQCMHKACMRVLIVTCMHHSRTKACFDASFY
jgi:hypothetical protein